MKRARQHGSAAVELAILLVATMVLLPALALFAMVFFQYSTMKDATRDAAMYMASLPRTALINGDERQRAMVLARRIVSDAADASGMNGMTEVEEATVLCDGVTCDDIYPRSIDVNVSFTIKDVLFSHWTRHWTDDETHLWQVRVRSTIPVARK